MGLLLPENVLPAGEGLTAGDAAEVARVPVLAARLRVLLGEDELITGGTAAQTLPLGVVPPAEHLARLVEVDQIHQQLLRWRSAH